VIMDYNCDVQQSDVIGWWRSGAELSVDSLVLGVVLHWSDSGDWLVMRACHWHGSLHFDIVVILRTGRNKATFCIKAYY
jgi:hypothetical protein